MNYLLHKTSIVIGVISLFTYASSTLAIPEMRSSEENETVQINENISDDVYASGKNIEVNGNIAGDAVMAGINIILEKNVEQDTLLAGYHVEIKGSVNDDVRVAAHESFIYGDIADDVFALGKTVELNGAKIGGSIFIAAKEVKIIDIDAREGIKITAEKIFFNSNVSGIVNLEADEIEFGENAKINGNLIISSHNITGNTNLTSFVTGELTQKIIENDDDENYFESKIWVLAGFLLSVIIFSSIFLFLLPQFFTKISENITNSPWSSLALGWAWFILVPIISILLLITLFALPIGIFFLGLWALLFFIFPFICSATLAAFFISKCKDAGLMKKIFAIIISSIIVIIPFSLIIIAPFVMGGILKNCKK